jgi:hypothetical protein
MRPAWPVGLLLLAGCADPLVDEDNDHGEGCPHTEAVSWDDPGLYAAMRPFPNHSTTWSAGAGALPWENSSLLEGIPLPRLTHVSWSGPYRPYLSEGVLAYQEPGPTSMRLVRDGVVEGAYDGAPDEQRLRSAYMAFATNLSAASQQALEQGWQEYFDSGIRLADVRAIPDPDGEGSTGQEQWSFVGRLPLPWRLEEFASELGLEPAHVIRGQGGVDLKTGQWASWNFHFSVPSWEVERLGTQALTVDAFGNAAYWVLDHAASDDQAKEEARAFVTSEIGYEPDLTAATVSRLVC